MVRLIESNDPPTEVEDYGFYRKAVTASESFVPVQDAEYDWVLRYALEQYDRTYQSLVAIDAKADQLIRYIGAGTGLLVVILSGAVNKIHESFSAILVAGVILAVVAMVYALRVRKTEARAFPPTVLRAIRLIEHYEGNRHWTSGQLATEVCVAMEDLTVTTQTKGAYQNRAFQFFGVTVICLLILAPVAALWGEAIICWVADLL